MFAIKAIPFSSFLLYNNFISWNFLLRYRSFTITKMTDINSSYGSQFDILNIINGVQYPLRHFRVTHASMDLPMIGALNTYTQNHGNEALVLVQDPSARLTLKLCIIPRKNELEYFEFNHKAHFNTSRYTLDCWQARLVITSIAQGDELSVRIIVGFATARIGFDGVRRKEFEYSLEFSTLAEKGNFLRFLQYATPGTCMKVD
jgi:hypothetical protein